MNDTQIRAQLELEGVEAKGQSLPNRLQRRFLEAPESEESPQALETARPFNHLGLGYREKLPSELYSLQLPRLILDVDADRMC